ncbi:hypothetical protein [Dapis sp. BLCC M229]|uniref:hypothetical protein n=1 Tax=Dapis sp. BLCC M229 TaxID=3400188 RepID=UPI003CF3B99E
MKKYSCGCDRSRILGWWCSRNGRECVGRNYKTYISSPLLCRTTNFSSSDRSYPQIILSP